MSGYMPIVLCAALAATFLVPSKGYITMGDDNDFPMGMGYDEGYNIKRVRPKKSERKTIGSYRLPRNVLPVHYDIEVRPIIESPQKGEKMYTAPGCTCVRVKVVEPTNNITVHVKGIRVRHESVKIFPHHKTETKVAVSGHNKDFERSFYTIFLDNDLTVGDEYTLVIPFVSKVYKKTELLAGIYTVNFKGTDGTEKAAVVTQFQKDDASRAFPCFDEPDMKAEFTFKIGRKTGYISLSNAPQNGDPVPINGSTEWFWDIYETSPPFPTYDMGFAVLPDYDHEATSEGIIDVNIKSWVPALERNGSNVKFAAQASGQIMKYFEDLFQMEYPLKKMDNLAVPEMDLLAMEHPGLVTYRTSLLVWKKGLDTQYEIFNGASLISHEFAHQWFGNMVTCKWWNDFWLNEAFARYYQFVGANQGSVDFRAMDRFVIDVVQWAMEFDEGSDTTALRPDETDRVFYLPFHIEYEKGASLVRMMQTILTEKTFIRALRSYFKKHKWGNTVQEDLFEAFTEAAEAENTVPPFPMAKIMKPWLTKTGFPILQVARGESDRLYITQQRFIIHPAANDKIEPGLWYVPIWYVTKSNPHFDGDNTPPSFIMDPDTLTRYIPMNNTQDWIIVNPEARGYYRVVYDRVLTNLIVKQLEEDHLVFHFSTRSQLFDDYMRSARARYISTAHAMSLYSYLHKEDDLVVWTSVFNNFRRVIQRAIDTPLVGQFKKFVLSKIIPPFLRMRPLGEDDSFSHIIMYSMFFDWICTLEDVICDDIVRDYMIKWMKDPSTNPVPVDIQPTVYCAAVAGCPEGKIQEFLMKEYHSTEDSRQRNLIARGLTCDKETDQLKSLLEKAINHENKDIDTTEHGLTVLTHIAKNPNGRKVVWEFLKSNPQSITDALGSAAIPSIIETVSVYMSNRGVSNLNYEFLDYIYNYLKLNPDLPKAERDSMQSSAQKIVDNSLWMDYSYHEIENWLKENVK